MLKKEAGILSKLVLIATACAAFASACGGLTGGRRAGQGDPTRELFARNCAACHGPTGEGQQVGSLNVPSLRATGTAEATDERLFRQIYDGGGKMPPFKYTLTDEQIQALVRFVRGIQGKGK